MTNPNLPSLHGHPSRVVRPNRSPTRQKLRLAILLDQVDVLMAHPELALKIDARLVRERHARLEQHLRVPLVQVGRFMCWRKRRSVSEPRDLLSTCDRS